MTDKNSQTKSAKFPLRATLVVPFVLQIITAVSLVGYFSFRSGQQAVSDLANQLIDSASQRVDEHLDAYLSLPHQINQLNASAIAEGQLDLQDTTALQKHFWRQAKVFDSVGYLGFARPDGSEAGAGRWINGIDLLVFDSSLEGASIDYLADERGNPSQVVQTYEYDPRDNSWYKDVITAKKPIWSGVITGIASNLEMTEAGEALQQPEDQNSTLGINSFYVVAAARHPIYSATGKLRGILVTDLVLTEISKFLSKLQVSPGGQVFIVERDGTLVASSGKFPVMGVVEEQSVRLTVDTTEDPRLKAVSRAVEDNYNGFQAIQAQQDLKLDVEGENLFVEVLPWQDEYGLDWVVVVAVPESDFMAQINQNTRNTVLLCLAALGIAIAIGILTARTIANPVLRITETSQQMSGGKLDRRVKESSRILEMETLARSFNSMASQLRELFNNLEDKVKERTAELAQANVEITSLNEKLKAENLRMSAELDVARQLQQMVLPKPEELENLEGIEVAGFMEPADEVGGDYYDVLQTDGVVTIGIGDVTGHGLESGILMLMTQTAVRTLHEIREDNPVKFLDTLNRTIYNNVQRMNSEKNLTLAILNYVEGKVSISGQHEETIVVRAGGEIEAIDTMDLGLPIGIDDDIADFIDHTFVELNPGDGVIVYTDGIPEAFDLNKKQYGMEQFYQVIKQNWHLSAKEIEQAIIKDVRVHIDKQKVFDDITLVVLKRQVTVDPKQPKVLLQTIPN